MEETRQKAPGNGHFPAVLRFVAALLLSGTLCLAWGGGNLLAQIRSIYVTIDAADASIREILESIEAQSDLRFIYADEVKPILTKVVTVREKNVSANRILDQILPDVGLQYSVGGTQVRIYQAASGSRDVAQTVSGTVISGTDNSPLAGVMIYVEGTTAGTITNGDGSYTFTIPAKSKYVTFSYVGFDTKKLHVEDTELFKLVSLAEQSNALDEVVVIGYGTQKKESMVASITSVKPSDLNITSSSLTTAFAGNIAGMISRQTSGEPGYDSASFYIRGISTFGSSNAPLIILDGVEVLSNMLNNMPPESIESFSVLKDAQATSVYGSRGANGVILINTKNGRNSEKMNVSVRLENTFSMPTMVQQVADGVTYMQLYNEAVFNTAKETGTLHAYQPFYSADKINGTKAGLNKYLYPNNDWYDLMFKDFSVNQNLNLNIRSGGRKVSYFLNAAVSNENGIIADIEQNPYDVKMNHQKYIFQSNVSANITKTTVVGIKVNAQLEYNTRPIEDIGNLFYYSMRANPVRFPATLPAEEGDTFVRYGNNAPWDTGATDLNPLAKLSRGYGKRYYSYMTTAFTLDQNLDFFTKGLSANLTASFYNYTYSATYRTATPYYFKVEDGSSLNPDGTANLITNSIGDTGTTYLTSTDGNGGHRRYALQASLNYARKFGKHDVGAMFVYRMNEKKNNIAGTSEENLLPYREQGMAGRVTYGFDNRYLGELRSRQTLGFLPLGGGRLGDLQRVVLGRHPQDGQQPEDPRIVRSGGQRRLGRALPLPLHRGHGRRIGILLQLELPGQRPEDHHLRQPQRDVGGGQETRRRSRTGTVQRAEHRSRLLHRRPYGHLHAAHLAAFVDGPAGRYALRQYRTCEIARRRPFGRLQQAVQQGLVAEPARHVHLLAQRSGREG